MLAAMPAGLEGWARSPCIHPAPSCPRCRPRTARRIRTATSRTPQGSPAGYNFQLGNWVAGVEADFNGASLEETGSASYGFIPFVTTPLGRPWDSHNETIGESLNWFSTVRARLGYAWGRLLVYATGGLAIVNVDSSFDYFDTVLNIHFNGQESRTLTGAVAGGGLEWLLTNNSVKAEYLYLDAGTFSYTGPTNIPGAPFRWGADVKTRKQFARVGLNYKFDFPGPIGIRQ